MRNEKCIYILMGQTDWIGASVGGGGALRMFKFYVLSVINTIH